MENDVTGRPFYSEYAWAFNLLIDRPVRKECSAIVDWLVARGVTPGSRVLDAGCGTGRYSLELARRGYVVDAIDLSPELIAIAEQEVARDRQVTFTVGDIRHPQSYAYDAILCRGVLNDVLDDDNREAVFASFAQSLRSGGVLVLDVREWEMSARRKIDEPLFRKRVSTDRGELTFTSVTQVEPETRRLRIAERHELLSGGRQTSREFEFDMRCWTRDELGSALLRHGFIDPLYFGAYDPDVALGNTDRIVAITSRGHAGTNA
jgi:SAM-dependent methyltransferase